MANVRVLLVLSLVCLLLCQMMSLSEACAKSKKCASVDCGTFCCHGYSMCLSSCTCLATSKFQQQEYAILARKKNATFKKAIIASADINLI
ncbi:hypothetical protein LSAT2_009195 [Lamellibrachia satsuma]|nr:hypothetical protein LSAT2_009195 [Lamellibrachia satsuma]